MTYQLVGECAYISTNTALGRAKVLMHKGALLDDDVPELKHLLSIGMAARVGGEETGGVNAAGEPAAVADGTVVPAPDGSRALAPAADVEAEQAEQGATTGTLHGQSLTVTTTGGGEQSAEEKSAAETAERRRVAREKLAKLDGKTPDGRHHEDVLVEYLVAQGGSYDDLARAEKNDLLDLVKQRQS